MPFSKRALGASISIFALLVLVSARPVHAASSSHTMEIYPFFGLNLPHDVEGLDNTVKGFGARAAYVIEAPLSLEAGGFYWKDGDNNGKTLDGGISYELIDGDVKGYVGAGLHYSQYKIEPTGADSDTGGHFGLYAGGGVLIPLSDRVPFKAGLRFYKGPSYWVLIDIGVGIRF